MNDPYETTEAHITRLLGRALNSFDLPDLLVERLDAALAHASSLSSAHHSAGLHRETFRHTYLLTDGSTLTLWELVHNTGRDGAQLHELYAEEAEVRLAASRLYRPGSPQAPRLAPGPDTPRLSPGIFPGSSPDPGAGPAGGPCFDELTADLTAELMADLESGGAADTETDFALLGSLLAAPPAPLPRTRMYVPDNSADHARRVLRRAENADRPGERTARLLRTAFAHHITQVFGRQCQVEGKDAGFMLYEHAFLLIDGTETSVWEVEHTATPDGRHMCEVYESERAARAAMELRAQVR
ncbi:DUF6227 family protein [Streptomyces sp. NPDC088725]|uniref:DUF6227 family protein n=1 Tax=Streptomyces sp. NPDC088725 TaxID=3365873 RepID=UPI00382F6D02